MTLKKRQLQIFLKLKAEEIWDVLARFLKLLGCWLIILAYMFCCVGILLAIAHIDKLMGFLFGSESLSWIANGICWLMVIAFFAGIGFLIFMCLKNIYDWLQDNWRRAGIMATNEKLAEEEIKKTCNQP